MKFRINKSALLPELDAAVAVAEKKATIPVLAMLRLSVEGNRLSIVGSDLDVTLSTSCSVVATEEEGATLVNGAKLTAFVRQLPDGSDIALNLKDNYLHISGGKAKAKLPTLAVDNFPDVAIEFNTPHTLNAAAFPAMVKRVVANVTMEESRYALQGVQTEIRADEFRMVATDGHRCSKASLQGEFVIEGEMAQAIVPTKPLNLAAKMAAGNDKLQIGLADNNFAMRVGNRLIVTRTMSGTYPNYEIIYPRKHDGEITLDMADLDTAMRQVSVMLEDGTKYVKTVKLAVGSSRIDVTCQTDLGESTAELPCTASEPFTVTMNATYLSEYAGASGSGLASFKYVKHSDAYTFDIQSQLAANANLHFVLMSFRDKKE